MVAFSLYGSNLCRLLGAVQPNARRLSKAIVLNVGNYVFSKAGAIKPVGLVLCRASSLKYLYTYYSFDIQQSLKKIIAQAKGRVNKIGGKRFFPNANQFLPKPTLTDPGKQKIILMLPNLGLEVL